VLDCLKDDFSLVLGESFDPLAQRNLELNIKGVKFWIHPGIDVTNDNAIVFISIRFLTEDKSELIFAMKTMEEYFELKGVPNLNMSSVFYTASMYYVAQDSLTGGDLKLIVWDRVSSMQSRYEIELKIE
jgi:hypothetical protein